MAVNDIYRLNVITANNPSIAVAVNGFYFRQRTALILDTPEEDLVAAFQEECEFNYLNTFTSAMFLIKYQVGKSPEFATAFEVFDGVQHGGLTGDPLPPRNCAVLSKKTSDFSRRGRGRTYLPPASESVSSGIGLTTGYRTALTDFAANVQDDMNAETLTHAGWQHVLWSEADQEAKTVTSYIINLRWASQRDRGNLY